MSKAPHRRSEAAGGGGNAVAEPFGDGHRSRPGRQRLPRDRDGDCLRRAAKGAAEGDPAPHVPAPPGAVHVRAEEERREGPAHRHAQQHRLLAAVAPHQILDGALKLVEVPILRGPCVRPLAPLEWIGGNVVPPLPSQPLQRLDVKQVEPGAGVVGRDRQHRVERPLRHDGDARGRRVRVLPASDQAQVVEEAQRVPRQEAERREPDRPPAAAQSGIG